MTKLKKLASQNQLMSTDSSVIRDPSSWVIHIRSFFLEEELDVDDPHEDTSVCVFNVPKPLLALKPEAYTPQLVAMGPYHHWRQELYEMERYKLICAKRIQKEFHNLKFEELVKKLLKKEHEIRGCYHKYLDMDGEAVAWMMAIDGLFLLEFLQIHASRSQQNDGVLAASSTRTSYLINVGRKLAYDSILKDIMMFENQIPIFVLRKILQIQCTSSDSYKMLLPPMLMGICRELSPLQLNEDYPTSDTIQCAHLLDLLYRLIVPRLEENEDEIQSQSPSKDDGDDEPSIGENKEVLTDTWQMASKLNVMSKFTKVFDLKPVKLMLQMPLKVVSKLPIVSALVPTLENMFSGDGRENSKNNKGSSDKELLERVPLVEEIMVPSVSELSNAGVEFCPTEASVSTIQFDPNTKKFYLPVVHLDGNTEIVMRNLVAYEAAAISGPLVLARYTELMNGIIDAPADVEILRQRGIIISRLKSDKSVADLWNGMTKAIRLTKVSFIDTAIEGANKYYHSTPKVRYQRLMKSYVYGSWQILVIFATLLMLGLMGLQAFCSVYSCPRLFNITDANSTTGTTHP